MKKLLVVLSSVVVAVALFTVVAYGSNGLNFNGEGQIDQSDKDVAEILNILKQVHDEKELTEEQLADLEALNIKEIAKLNKDIKGLENDISDLNAEKEKLELDNLTLTTDLGFAKIDIAEQKTKISNLNKTIDNLNGTVAGLEADVETHTKTIAQKNTEITILTDANFDLESELSTEKSKNSENNDYIAHLEGQLETANEAVAAHSGTTKSAVEKARTYIND